MLTVTDISLGSASSLYLQILCFREMIIFKKVKHVLGFDDLFITGYGHCLQSPYLYL